MSKLFCYGIKELNFDIERRNMPIKNVCMIIPVQTGMFEGKMNPFIQNSLLTSAKLVKMDPQ